MSRTARLNAQRRQSARHARSRSSSSSTTTTLDPVPAPAQPEELAPWRHSLRATKARVNMLVRAQRASASYDFVSSCADARGQPCTASTSTTAGVDATPKARDQDKTPRHDHPGSKALARQGSMDFLPTTKNPSLVARYVLLALVSHTNARKRGAYTERHRLGSRLQLSGDAPPPPAPSALMLASRRQSSSSRGGGGGSGGSSSARLARTNSLSSIAGSPSQPPRSAPGVDHESMRMQAPPAAASSLASMMMSDDNEQPPRSAPPPSTSPSMHRTGSDGYVVMQGSNYHAAPSPWSSSPTTTTERTHTRRELGALASLRHAARADSTPSLSSSSSASTSSSASDGSSSSSLATLMSLECNLVNDDSPRRPPFLSTGSTGSNKRALGSGLGSALPSPSLPDCPTLLSSSSSLGSRAHNTSSSYPSPPPSNKKKKSKTTHRRESDDDKNEDDADARQVESAAASSSVAPPAPRSRSSSHRARPGALMLGAGLGSGLDLSQRSRATDERLAPPAAGRGPGGGKSQEMPRSPRAFLAAMNAAAMLGSSSSCAQSPAMTSQASLASPERCQFDRLSLGTTTSSGNSSRARPLSAPGHVENDPEVDVEATPKAKASCSTSTSSTGCADEEDTDMAEGESYFLLDRRYVEAGNAASASNAPPTMGWERFRF